MDITKMLEEKRQQLRNVEQREAFLRSQLEECVHVRLQLIGQVNAVAEIAQAMEAEKVVEKAEEPEAAPRPPLARTPRGRPHKNGVAHGHDA